jgi:hypothetical protein
MSGRTTTVPVIRRDGQSAFKTSSVTIIRGFLPRSEALAVSAHAYLSVVQHAWPLLAPVWTPVES